MKIVFTDTVERDYLLVLQLAKGEAAMFECRAIHGPAVALAFRSPRTMGWSQIYKGHERELWEEISRFVSSRGASVKVTEHANDDPAAAA